MFVSLNSYDLPYWLCDVYSDDNTYKIGQLGKLFIFNILGMHFVSRVDYKETMRLICTTRVDASQLANQPLATRIIGLIRCINI